MDDNNSSSDDMFSDDANSEDNLRFGVRNSNQEEDTQQIAEQQRSKRNQQDIALLGFKLDREELKDFGGSSDDEFDETKIKDKVQRFMDEENEYRRPKKKAPNKKLLGALTDPVVFNGITKGITVLHLSYHFNLFKKLASNECIGRLESILPIEIHEAICRITEQRDLLSEGQRSLIILKISYYCLALFYEDKEISKLFREILRSFGVEEGEHGDYLMTISHNLLLEIMGIRTRIVFSYNYDKFPMNKMFFIKGEKKKAKKKTSKKSFDECDEEEELNLNDSVTEEDALEYTIANTDRKLKSKINLSSILDRLLTKENFDNQENMSFQNKEISAAFYDLIIFSRSVLGSYCDVASNKTNAYFLELWHIKKQNWKLINISRAGFEPITFYEKNFLNTTTSALFAISRLSCGRPYMRDISLERLPNLITHVFLNRYRLSSAKIKINSIFEMFECQKANSFLWMNSKEKLMECIDFSRKRDLEIEFLFNKEGNMRYSTFFDRTEVIWNQWNKFIPGHDVSEITLGKKTIKIAQSMDLVLIHTLVGWKERCRTILKSELDNPILEEEYFVPGKTSRFYAYWQTEPMTFQLNEDGTIPKNEYGNIEIMYGLPPGTKHIPIKGIKRACNALNIDFAESVVDFQYKQGMVRPLILGAVIHSQNAVAVIYKHRELRKKSHLNKDKRHDQEMQKIWRMIFKSIYLKLYLKETLN